MRLTCRGNNSVSLYPAVELFDPSKLSGAAEYPVQPHLGKLSSLVFGIHCQLRVLKADSGCRRIKLHTFLVLAMMDSRCGRG